MKESDKFADQLIETIKQWHQRANGVVLSSKEILKEATQVIKDRLK